MKEKKNEIIIGKSHEGYSLHYVEENSGRAPQPIINGMKFYDIIDGIINLHKNIYKKGIKKIYFNEYDSNEILEKEKEIFKGLINILERSASGEENLENKIEEIKKIFIKKEDKEKFLEMEISMNKRESFNSLYKIIKE